MAGPGPNPAGVTGFAAHFLLALSHPPPYVAPAF